MLFLSYYINKRACIAQLVDKDVCKPWDLGSIPRSPTYFIYFVLTRFCAACSQRFTICLRQLACHMSSNANSKAMMRVPGYTPVNASTRKSEKSNGLAFHGPDYSQHTSSIWVNTPICLHFLLFFFLFFHLF